MNGTLQNWHPVIKKEERNVETKQLARWENRKKKRKNVSQKMN